MVPDVPDSATFPTNSQALEPSYFRVFSKVISEKIEKLFEMGFSAFLQTELTSEKYISKGSHSSASRDDSDGTDVKIEFLRWVLL